MQAQCYSGQHIAYRLGTQQLFDRRCLEKAFYPTLPRLRGNAYQKGYDWVYPAMAQHSFLDGAVSPLAYHQWKVLRPDH